MVLKRFEVVIGGVTSAKTKIIRRVHFGRQEASGSVRKRQEASGSVSNNGFRQVAPEAELNFCA